MRSPAKGMVGLRGISRKFRERSYADERLLRFIGTRQNRQIRATKAIAAVNDQPPQLVQKGSLFPALSLCLGGVAAVR
jgi:hypothetical protein